MKTPWVTAAGVALLFGACAAAGLLLVGAAGQPRQRSFKVVARKYAYNPPRLRVNVGDTVTIRFSSGDATHGFYLEGHDIDAKVSPEEKPRLRHPSRGGPYEEVESITFVASRAGKFRYRCSQTCGYLHPFMAGELVVAPNRPYGVGLGGAVGLALAMLILAARQRGPNHG